jgi:hypothetical protein
VISGMGHSRRPSHRNPISRPEDIFYRKVDVGEGAENTFCERHEVGWPMKRAAILPVTDGNGIRGEKLVTPWIFLRTALCIRAVIRFVRSSGKPGLMPSQFRSWPVIAASRSQHAMFTRPGVFWSLLSRA